VTAVIDTNLLVSGFLWEGNPARLLQAIAESIPILEAVQALERLGIE
jgi:predicted nucleic acid-binding protein